MRTVYVAAALAAVGVAGCTPYSEYAPAPSVTGQITPAAIPPGATVNVSYAVRSAPAVSSVTLVGLPQNTLAAGTNPTLTLPLHDGQPMDQAFIVNAPAAAGVYPLQLRVGFADGTTTNAPLGTLTIADVPGTIESASIEPGGHALAACATPTTTANLRYVVSDPNGAGDVTSPVLNVPSFPAVTYYQSTVPAMPSVAAVTTVMPSGQVITQPVVPAAPVIGQAVPVAVPPTQPVTVLLAPPNAANATRQSVVTAISIACHLPPGTWSWQVQATDIDQNTGVARLIGPVPVTYTTR